MKASLYLLLLALPVFISCGSAKKISNADKRTIQQKVSQSPASFTGIAVKELGKEGLVLNYNAHKLFTPASNIKLLTLFAVQQLVGDSLEIFEYHKEGNTLHIRGNGNPVLLHPKFEHLNKEWMKGLLDLEIDTLIIHHREMTNGRFGPGWAWDDYHYYFQAEISSLPLFGNSLWVDWYPPNETVELYPDHIAKYADVKVQPGSEKIKISREEYSNSFTIMIGGKAKPKSPKAIPFLTDAYTSTQILQDTMPVDVSYTYDLSNYEWKDFTAVPMDTVYRRMMMNSDNFIAEQLMLAASSKFGDTLNTEKVKDHISSKYFAEYRDNLNWSDGSGLSRYNLISPHLNLIIMDSLLSEIPKSEWSFYIPKLGKEGTVKSGFESLSMTNIFGKSGSLKHHYALSGYFITADDRVMLYSIMLDNALTSQSELKKEVNSLLKAIYRSL